MKTRLQISERMAFRSGIQASRRFDTHNRWIGETLYRFVSYELGDCRYVDTPGKGHGYTVYRVPRFGPLVKVHQFGPELPLWSR